MHPADCLDNRRLSQRVQAFAVQDHCKAGTVSCTNQIAGVFRVLPSREYACDLAIIGVIWNLNCGLRGSPIGKRK